MLLYVLYRLGEFIALCVPVKASYALAVLISDIKLIFSPSELREMVENLRLIQPGVDEKTLRRCARQICANFSKYLVDFFRFRKVDLSYLEKRVEITGRHFIDEALKRGKGAILLSAHLGSWELGGAILGVLGYPISVIALDHKNRRVNNFFISQRKSRNENIISTKFAIRKCLAALANNNLIAIVGDKNFSNTGTVVKFFGKDTLLPKGPAFFSLKTQTVIIPAFSVRVEGDNFNLILGKPIEFRPEGDLEKDINRLTQLCAWEIERCIKQYPAQWYCFRRFWLDQDGFK